MTDFQDDVSEDFYEANWLVLDVNTRMVTRHGRFYFLRVQNQLQCYQLYHQQSKVKNYVIITLINTFNLYNVKRYF